MLVFLNGQFVPEEQALIPVNDRGFLLGDGLFETMRVAGGRPFRIRQHLERLARGADYLKIKLPVTPQALEKFARQLIERNAWTEAVLRLTLTRGPGGRGYAPDKNAKPTIVMTLHPAPGTPSTASARSAGVQASACSANKLKLELQCAESEFGAPIRWNLITSSFRIPVGDPLASFKTTSKILHVMARVEAVKRGADEALLLNTKGEVAETAGGNLFWIRGDKVCTVPMESGILPGITRAAVLEICQSLGLETDIQAIKPAALRNRAGLFVTQSVFGVVPVATFDDKVIASSPLVDRITRAYQEMLDRR